MTSFSKLKKQQRSGRIKNAFSNNDQQGRGSNLFLMGSIIIIIIIKPKLPGLLSSPRSVLSYSDRYFVG